MPSYRRISTTRRWKRCFCPECGGARQPWSSWSRHYKALQEKSRTIEDILSDNASFESASSPSTFTSATTSTSNTAREAFRRTLNDMEIKIQRSKGQLLKAFEELRLLQSYPIDFSPGLVFAISPDPADVNSPDLQLKENCTQNQSIIYAEFTCKHLNDRTRSTQVFSDRWLALLRAYLLERLNTYETSLEHNKRLVWEAQMTRVKNCSNTGIPVVNTDIYFKPIYPQSYRNSVQICLFFITAAMYLLFTPVSERATNFTAAAFQSAAGLIITTMAVRSSAPLHPHHIIGSSYSLKTALKHFNLDPITTPFACCPKCSRLHIIHDRKFETHCLFKDFDGNTCNTALVESTTKMANGSVAMTPIRLFEYQSIKDWIARLLSRPMLEGMMNREAASSHSSDTVRDFWEAEFVKTILWKDGSPFFRGSDPQPGETRLLFEIAVDWFGAYHTGAGKKSWSVGAIWLTCLNLPPHLRYRQENVCLVGVIPGPTKPSLEEINHFLYPLVQDLLVLWDTGIWLTRTYTFPTGRLVRGALSVLVCDLEAARPVGGFTSFNSLRFCSYCMTHLHSMHKARKANDLKPRNTDEHRRLADLWLGMRPGKPRSDFEEEHGVRWTALLELPYWEPSRSMVLDVMHNAFLGNLRHHIRDVWHQTSTSPDGDGSGFSWSLPENAGQLYQGWIVIERGTREAMKNLNSTVLETYCWAVGYIKDLGPSPGKTAMINFILDKRREKDGGDLDVPQDASDFYFLMSLSPSNWAKNAGIERLRRMCNTRIVPNGGQPFKRGDGNSAAALANTLRRIAPELYPPAPNAWKTWLMETETSMRPDRNLVVIGSQLMREFWLDLKSTVLPSWLPPAPKNMGLKAHGTPSADHWRTACTVHFIITLVKCWGPGRPASTANPRYLSMLDNYIHLVLATSLSSRRSSSPFIRQRILHHVEAYLEGLRVLYPCEPFAYNNHFALHTVEMLRWFGPPHSWWAFPFERYNGLLERLSTNSRFRDLETTMTRVYSQMANIKAIIFDRAVPMFLQPMLDLAEKYVKLSYRGTLLDDHVVFDYDAWEAGKVTQSVILPADEDKSIQDAGIRPGRFLSDIRRGNEKYTPYSESKRNCAIIFQAEADYRPKVGLIHRLVESATGDLFMLVKRLEELAGDDVGKDPFMRYPELQGGVFYASSSSTVEVIPVSRVIGHVAICPWTDAANEFSRSVVITLSLSRW